MICVVCHRLEQTNTLGWRANEGYKLQFLPAVCQKCAEALNESFFSFVTATRAGSGSKWEGALGTLGDKAKTKNQREAKATVRALLEDMGIDPGEDL